MSHSMPPPSPEPSSADSLYAAFLFQQAEDGVRWEDFLAEHPGRAEELGRLHADWQRLEPVVQACLSRGSLLPASGELPSPAFERTLPAERYSVNAEVGRGGMGVVYEAYDEALQRPLAMKMVRSVEGGRAAGLEARFWDEARLTAQLEHPGVVPVHDLGIDAEGRAYFTMRLVRGESLAHVYAALRAREGNWTRTRILSEFVKACQAVAFAHGRGVVHRDLKPENVMLGEFGEVYVMDWGLARPFDAEDAESSEEGAAPSTSRGPYETVPGGAVGTPSYMPPEQARGEAGAAGEGADVYALGAMLYELLAGTRPHIEAGERASSEEVLRRVREGGPQPLERVAPGSPPELIAICERAMEREPTRRYPSVLALVEDLTAYLDGRVVRAYRTGAWVELTKWVRRNRATAVASAAAVVAALSGLSGTAYVQAQGRDEQARIAGQLQESNAEKDVLNRELAQQLVLVEAARESEELAKVEAQEQAEEARLRAATTHRVLLFVKQMFSQQDPGFAAGEPVLLRDVLARSTARIETELLDEPDVRSRWMELMGYVWLQLGELDRAEPLLVEAHELRRSISPAGDLETLTTRLNLLGLTTARGAIGEAERGYRELLRDAEQALGAKSELVWAVHNGLWSTVFYQGRGREAVEGLQVAVAGAREHLGGDHRVVRSLQTNLAMSMLQAGSYAEAEQLLRTLEAELAETRADGHPELLATRGTLAILSFQTGRYAEAEALFAAIVAGHEATYGGDHPSTLNYLGNLALTLKVLGKTPEALSIFERLLAIPSSPDDPLPLVWQHNYGQLLVAQGRHDEAEPIFRAVLEGRLRLSGPNHPDTLKAYDGLGSVLALQGEDEEAERLMRLVFDGRRALLGDHEEAWLAGSTLAAFYIRRGRLDEAEAILPEAVAGLERRIGRQHRYTLIAILNQAKLLAERGRREEALPLAREAVEGLLPTEPGYEGFQAFYRSLQE